MGGAPVPGAAAAAAAALASSEAGAAAATAAAPKAVSTDSLGGKSGLSVDAGQTARENTPVFSAGGLSGIASGMGTVQATVHTATSDAGGLRSGQAPGMRTAGGGTSAGLSQHGTPNPQCTGVAVTCLQVTTTPCTTTAAYSELSFTGVRSVYTTVGTPITSPVCSPAVVTGVQPLFPSFPAAVSHGNLGMMTVSAPPGFQPAPVVDSRAALMSVPPGFPPAPVVESQAALASVPPGFLPAPAAENQAALMGLAGQAGLYRTVPTSLGLPDPVVSQAGPRGQLAYTTLPSAGELPTGMPQPGASALAAQAAMVGQASQSRVVTGQPVLPGQLGQPGPAPLPGHSGLQPQPAYGLGVAAATAPVPPQLFHSVAQQGGGSVAGPASLQGSQPGGSPALGQLLGATPLGNQLNRYLQGLELLGLLSFGQAGVDATPQLTVTQPAPLPASGSAVPAAVAAVAGTSASTAGPSSGTSMKGPAPTGSRPVVPDDTSSSSDDSSDSSSSSSEGDWPVLLHRTDDGGASADTVTGASTSDCALPDRTLTSELPDFTTTVLKRVSRGLGLPWDEGGEPAAQRVLSVGLPLHDAVATRPPFKLPADILDMWKSSTSAVGSGFANALRVTEEDYRELLYTSRMDDAVAEHLPSSGKAVPTGYSPFWEGELSGLDTRLATSIRLGGVGTAIADHLSKALSAQGGPDHPLVQEAMLLCDLSLHLVQGVMRSRRLITALRRQQALVQLTSVFGSKFIKKVQAEVGSQEFLFGGKFCDKLSERAVQLSNEALVREDAKTVREHKSGSKTHKKNKKAKRSHSRGASTSSASTSASRTTASSRPSTSSTPAPSKAGKNAKKRSAGGDPQPHVSKKSRRGKGGRK